MNMRHFITPSGVRFNTTSQIEAQCKWRAKRSGNDFSAEHLDARRRSEAWVKRRVRLVESSTRRVGYNPTRGAR
ncbi:hypothetical protein AMTR_s00076p00046300 [Amborella trichopoda]|uniref:Uncharacterized protein n=1 Tax=Amborella trichopoda TaxID=13333 RepID=W1PC82_AMBTC|nr:hypothetical protein AMTR_s00076p00046300 [Amborella trichopoda]